MKFPWTEQTAPSVIGTKYVTNERKSVAKLEDGSQNSLDNVDFETAMELTGYGLFNYLLIIAAIPASMATGFDTTVMSFVIPASKCHLNLTIFETGTLNAITFAGMVLSGCFWGYVADRYGRKNPIVLSLTLAALFDFICMFSINKWMLIIAKFLDGVVISGPYAISISYLSELHSRHYRARVIQIAGLASSGVQILLPTIAWFVIPEQIEIVVVEDVLVLRSWNVFLGICAAFPMLGAVVISFYPESPKFLLSKGRTDEALEVFQMMYSCNTGRPAHTFPAKSLKNEAEIPKDVQTIYTLPTKGSELIGNTKPVQISSSKSWIPPLFQKPYLNVCLLMFPLQVLLLSGLNTVRLWLPQLFSAIDHMMHASGNAGPLSICEVISHITSKNGTSVMDGKVLNHAVTHECLQVPIKNTAFFNSIIIGAVQFGFYVISGHLINITGKKRLLIIFSTIGGCLAFLLIFATNIVYILVMASLYLSLMSVSATVLIGISADVVPTSLRSMCVSLLMMWGRLGSVSGSFVFPLILQLGCYTPFLIVSSLSFVAATMGLFLPKTDKIALL